MIDGDSGCVIRIGIDGRRLGVRPKGISRYIWELCKGLDHVLPEARFYLYSPWPLILPQISPRWSLRVDQSQLRRLPSNFWLVAGIWRLARGDNLDSFWSGSGLLPLIDPRVRSVLTVHDIVHKVAPQTMETRALWATRLFFRSSVTRADAIVSNSYGTARRLQQYFGRRVSGVVRPGLSQVFYPRTDSEIQQVTSRYGVERPYLLAVATWEPRKCLELLIGAFVKMKANGALSRYKLVLVGDRGWKDAAVVKLAQYNSKWILRLGFVDDESLAALYAGAEAFIFPSCYEGFGMPVLEARACGTRVVTSDLPELREAGGRASIYIDPTEQGIEFGIKTALQQKTTEKVDWRDWHWDKSAAVLAEVILRRPPNEWVKLPDTAESFTANNPEMRKLRKFDDSSRQYDPSRRA